MSNQTPSFIYPNMKAPVPAHQFVSKSGSQVSGSFEIGRSTWTEHWDILGDDLQQAIEYILGFSKAGGPFGDVGVISRYLPAYSNQFPNMFATAITGVEALAPQGIGPMSEATFKQFRLTIQFETLPYDLLSDIDVNAARGGGEPAESFRYVVWNRQPASEFARTPYNAYKYPPGTGSKNANNPLPGQNGQAILLTKYRITGTWLQVPTDWISSDGGKTFPDLDAAVGTVNDATFLGYPAGTMLFESYEPTPRVLPTSALAVGQLDPQYIVRCYDIALKWLYFNPEPIWVPAGTTEFTAPRGHNLVFNPSPASNGGYWQRAVHRQSVTDVNGDWLYYESDHDKIFNNPSV